MGWSAVAGAISDSRSGSGSSSVSTSWRFSSRVIQAMLPDGRRTSTSAQPWHQQQHSRPPAAPPRPEPCWRGGGRSHDGRLDGTGRWWGGTDSS